MRRWQRSLPAIVLPLLFAEAAGAATIFTPPVIPNDDGDFCCVVTNVSPRTLTLRITVIDVNGVMSRQFGFIAPPLATRVALGRGATNDRLCQITVDAGRSAVRASVEVLSSSGEIEAVYPVP